MAYTQTNWENLPSTNTPLNQTNLNKIEAELINLDNNISNIFNSSAISVGLTTEQATTGGSGENKLNLDYTFVSRGNDLTLSNGAIVCQKAGIVEVSGSIAWKTSAQTGNQQFRIKKNNTIIGQNVSRAPSTNEYNQIMQSIIISVSVGDTISMYACNWTNVDLSVVNAQRSTVLNVKYI